MKSLTPLFLSSRGASSLAFWQGTSGIPSPVAVNAFALRLHGQGLVLKTSFLKPKTGSVPVLSSAGCQEDRDYLNPKTAALAQKGWREARISECADQFVALS
jgi:hypothetical protein